MNEPNPIRTPIALSESITAFKSPSRFPKKICDIKNTKTYLIVAILIMILLLLIGSVACQTGRANIKLRSVTHAPSEVHPDEKVFITAKLVNLGGQGDQNDLVCDVILKIGDTRSDLVEVERQTVRVGDEKTVTFEVSRNTLGTYTGVVEKEWKSDPQHISFEFKVVRSSAPSVPVDSWGDIPRWHKEHSADAFNVSIPQDLGNWSQADWRYLEATDTVGALHRHYDETMDLPTYGPWNLVEWRSLTDAGAWVGIWTKNDGADRILIWLEPWGLGCKIAIAKITP